MQDKRPAADIIMKIVNEITTEKGYTDKEKDIMLNKAVNLIGLAMAGYTSKYLQDDRQRIKEIIEGE